MLCHDASFGYIHAGKTTHDDNLLLKRTGYLAVTLFLNEDHDLIILIVSSLTTISSSAQPSTPSSSSSTMRPSPPSSLKSSTCSPIQRRLSARRLSWLFTGSIRNVLPSLISSRISVRGSVTMIPGSWVQLFALSVISLPYKDLVISFVSILKQVAERRLPKSYDYDQMPCRLHSFRIQMIL